jgi:hypothetical protein
VVSYCEGFESSGLAGVLAEKDDVMLFIALLHAGKGYLEDEGKPLELDRLLRLIALGAQLQADECVTQCVGRLAAKKMDIETGLRVMEMVPAEMDAYQEVKALREQAWTTLTDGIEVSHA